MTGVYYNSFTIYTDIFGKDVKNMKIEKVNDNQIRCTLTREDLEDRHIK